MAGRTSGVRRLVEAWVDTARTLVGPEGSGPLAVSRHPGAGRDDEGWSRAVTGIIAGTRHGLAAVTSRATAADSPDRDSPVEDRGAVGPERTRELLEGIARVLDGHDVPDTIITGGTTVRIEEHLRRTGLEMVGIALAAGIEVSGRALTEACRAAATILDRSHGGRTIELRVPPACAVQLAAHAGGPHHHRGTPPNVAETDPRTFLELVCGLTEWSHARQMGRVRASGSHVDDLERMFPVITIP